MNQATNKKRKPVLVSKALMWFFGIAIGIAVINHIDQRHVRDAQAQLKAAVGSNDYRPAGAISQEVKDELARCKPSLGKDLESKCLKGLAHSVDDYVYAILVAKAISVWIGQHGPDEDMEAAFKQIVKNGRAHIEDSKDAFAKYDNVFVEYNKTWRNKINERQQGVPDLYRTYSKFYDDVEQSHQRSNSM